MTVKCKIEENLLLLCLNTLFQCMSSLLNLDKSLQKKNVKENFIFIRLYSNLHLLAYFKELWMYFLMESKNILT